MPRPSACNFHYIYHHAAIHWNLLLSPATGSHSTVRACCDYSYNQGQCYMYNIASATYMLSWKIYRVKLSTHENGKIGTNWKD